MNAWLQQIGFALSLPHEDCTKSGIATRREILGESKKSTVPVAGGVPSL